MKVIQNANGISLKMRFNEWDALKMIIEDYKDEGESYNREQYINIINPVLDDLLEVIANDT